MPQDLHEEGARVKKIIAKKSRVPVMKELGWRSSVAIERMNFQMPSDWLAATGAKDAE